MCAAGTDDGALEKTTLRRMTWRILPFLMVCYFVSFVDRVNVGFAALEMNRDLHLSPAVFGFGGAIFYVSYFLFEVPSNLIMARVGARRWIARIMITWGAIAAGMALITGPFSFYTLRFLLGAAEAGFFPGIVLYLTYWFPAEHRARIVGLFTVAIPVSSFLGSPISAALFAADGWLGLRGWQWMFIAEAAPAILLGLACLVVLADGPSDARWLGPAERAWLEGKLAAERARPKPVSQQSLWQVLRHRHVLALAMVLGGSTAASSSLQLWQPQILKAFGLSTMETGLLNAVPFAVASVAMVLWGRRSDRRRERVWHTALPLALTTLALVATLLTGALGPTVVLLSLAVTGIYAMKGPFWALSSEWLAADAAAAGLAQINAVSNLAGSGAVYLIGLIKNQTGSYRLALLPLVVLAAAAVLIVLALGHAQPPRAKAAK